MISGGNRFLAFFDGAAVRESDAGMTLLRGGGSGAAAREPPELGADGCKRFGFGGGPVFCKEGEVTMEGLLWIVGGVAFGVVFCLGELLGNSIMGA